MFVGGIFAAALSFLMGGLNPSEVILILDKIKAIRSRGITVLLIEHVMEAVMSISERVIVLNYGQKISAGAILSVDGGLTSYVDLGEEFREFDREKS